MVIDEVIPYIEQHFPAIRGREGRALSGISYGGIGTGNIGLRHPDLFSSLHQISGMGLPGLCNGQDANAVKRAALGLASPTFGQSCHNALGLPVPPNL